MSSAGRSPASPNSRGAGSAHQVPPAFSRVNRFPSESESSSDSQTPLKGPESSSKGGLRTTVEGGHHSSNSVVGHSAELHVSFAPPKDAAESQPEYHHGVASPTHAHPPAYGTDAPLSAPQPQTPLHASPPRTAASMAQINNNSLGFNPNLLSSSSMVAVPSGLFANDTMPSLRAAMAAIANNEGYSDKDVVIRVPHEGTAGAAFPVNNSTSTPPATPSVKKPSTGGFDGSISGAITRMLSNNSLVRAASMIGTPKAPKKSNVSQAARRAFGSRNTNTTAGTPSESDNEGSASTHSRAHINNQSDLRSERTASNIFAVATSEAAASSTKSGWFGGDDDYDDDDNGSSFNANALYEQYTGKGLTWQARMRYVLDGNPHPRDAIASMIINTVLFATIITSIVVYCVSSFPSFNNSAQNQNTTLTIIESVCVGIFVLEALSRIVSASTWKSLWNLFFIIDVVSILGYFLDLTLRMTASGGASAGISVVRVVRLVRVFRVLKISRHSTSLQVVLIVIKTSLPSLIALMIPILLIIVIAGCVLYYVEISSPDYKWDNTRRVWLEKNQTAEIQSIPDVLWFSLATVTTVGFGDIVVQTYAARALGSVLQLIGVLIVSFPNIILGGNLTFTFREYNRRRAVRKLGKKFRRVYMCVCFISALREISEAKKALLENDGQTPEIEEDTLLTETRNGIDTEALLEGDGVGDAVPVSPRDRPLMDDGRPSGVANNHGVQNTAAKNAVDTMNTINKLINQARGATHVRLDSRMGPRKRVVTNYMIQKEEANSYRKVDSDPIDSNNIRSWTYKGISAVTILQRLLECCSGVGTTEEIHTTFVLNGGGGVTLKDVDIVCFYLLAADYLQIFAFKRFGLSMLLALTPQAISELMVHAEEGQVECIRSAEMARVLWRRTAGATVNFALHLLSGTYPIWFGSEKVVDNEKFTPYPDMKVLYDEEGNLKPIQFTSFANSFAAAAALALLDRSSSMIKRPSSAKAREKHRQQQQEADRLMREEAKEAMREVLARRSEHIATLRERLEKAKTMQAALDMSRSSAGMLVAGALSRQPSKLTAPSQQ